MINFFKRLLSYRNIELHDNGLFLPHPSTQLVLKKDSKIQIYGNVRIGFPIPGFPSYPSYDKTLIQLGKHARLIFNGNTCIAHGTSIVIGDDATVIFGGNNSIAHNGLIYCKNKIIIGTNSSISWNVTMMDQDEHSFYTPSGRKIKKLIKPLIIGNNVGMQMNVTIPRGVTVGDNTVISANTVIRKDIQPNCLVYQDVKLKIKDGFTTGFQIEY